MWAVISAKIRLSTGTIGGCRDHCADVAVRLDFQLPYVARAQIVSFLVISHSTRRLLLLVYTVAIATTVRHTVNSIKTFTSGLPLRTSPTVEDPVISELNTVRARPSSPNHRFRSPCPVLHRFRTVCYCRLRPS